MRVNERVMEQTSKAVIEVSGPHLRYFRKQLALSQRDFGEKIGLSESAVRSIEAGRTPRVYASTFRAIASAIGLTLEQARTHLMPPESELRGENPAGKIIDQNVEVGSFTPLVEIPTFELSVAAGTWVNVEGVEGVCFDAAQIQQGLFRVRISGDSMSPKYRSGDIVEFRCLRQDRDGFEPGKDYYVQQSDGTATFKRVQKVDEEMIELRALNRKKYPDNFEVSRGLIVRAARAVGWFKPTE